MKPDNVVEAIKKLGVAKVSRRTLLLWEKEKLVPQARRGSGGRGVGAYAEYPEQTPAEFCASWTLLYTEKLRYIDVAQYRQEGLDEHVVEKSALAKKWLEYNRQFSAVSQEVGRLKKLTTLQDEYTKIKEKITDPKRIISMCEDLDEAVKLAEKLHEENERLKEENGRLKEEINKLNGI